MRSARSFPAATTTLGDCNSVLDIWAAFRTLFRSPMVPSARRLPLLFALIIALIVGSIFYNRTREDRWRPLPGGGEIRWIAVTHEKPPSVAFTTKPPFLHPWRKHLSPWLRHLISPAPLEGGGSQSKPAVFVWFRLRNVPDVETVSFLLVRGDQLVHPRSSFGASRPDEKFVGVEFNDECRSQPRLLIRCTTNAGSIDFDIANPLIQASSR